MPKYGWFKTSGLNPNVEYEGDYIQMEKEFVKIYMHGTGDLPSPKLVAAIRLDKGQDVREMK
ncbi:MAG: hypothetical protein ACLQMO_12280 [Acidobacteriaceae bacterium]